LAAPLHLLGHSLGAVAARAAVLSTVLPYPWSSLTLLSSGPAAIQPEQHRRVQLLLQWLPVLGKEQLWLEMLMEVPDRTDELAATSLPMLVVCGQEDYAWPVS
jgi:hypothetical protein